jgi:hypothetical protein
VTRRRRTAVAIVVLLVAGGVAACTTIGHHFGGTTNTSGATTSSSSTTTTTPKPTSYNVGLTTFYWKDSLRTTVNYLNLDAPIAGRVLTTEVRYPTVEGSPTAETVGAKAATSDGPFPVIVFAHGFDVSPSYYSQLLDSWVRAGFIVVSPIFPDENTATVNDDGGPYSSGGVNDECDETNEPGDIPFVLRQFDTVAAPGSGKILAGLAETSDVALAGQSDGANVVGALAFGSLYSSDLLAMPVSPKAVAVLSGQQLIPCSGATNTYSASASSPALLQVQSDADTCNGAQQAADLFARLTAAPAHLFQTLHGATHLAPYANPPAGNPEYMAVVEKVTTQFFELELGWHAKGLTLASIETSGNQANVSQVTSTVTGFPSAPPQSNCAGQLP